MGECCRDVNPFRLCSGLRFLGYSMVLLVAALVGVSYYAVIVVAWGPHLLHGGSRSFLAFAIVILFHFLLVLLVWSYFMVVFHDPGEVPVGWQPASKDNYLELDVSVALTDHTSISTGEIEISSREGSEHRASIRYCSHCHNNKPARCHHCSVCQRCVLKMDHHCVWVVNCVGACNYKFFLLFLLYTFLETVLDSLALLPHFIKFFGDARNHSGSPGSLAVTFLSFVLNVAFALSLLCFVIMHTSLVLSNTTTIEVHEKKNLGEWKYDLGKRKNFEQVFGTNKLFWFIPLFSKTDLFNVPALRGLDFPTRSESEMEGIVKRETSFTSSCSPTEIMSKIEETAKPLGFNVHKHNYKMKLKGSKCGRKGHLSVATEVFEVAPSVHMVELRKIGGDTLEYHQFYKNFATGLKRYCLEHKFSSKGEELISDQW